MGILGKLVIMARLLPVLAFLAHWVMCHEGVKHVMAGEEYGITSRQEKSISPRGFGNEISEVNYKECEEPQASMTLQLRTLRNLTMSPSQTQSMQERCC